MGKFRPVAQAQVQVQTQEQSQSQQTTIAHRRRKTMARSRRDRADNELEKKLRSMTITRDKVHDASNLMAAVMETLGFDLEDENFDGTPERFVRYLLEYLTPFDPGSILKVDFTQVHQDRGYKGMVVQSNIPFRTICPHHLLPILGLCHLAYIPEDRLVGISKLTRIVGAVGHEMPRMQETVTDIIADTLMSQLKAKGVMVVVNADHACMTGRGVKVHNTPTTTSTVRGLFRDVSAAREEFFELARLRTRGQL